MWIVTTPQATSGSGLVVSSLVFATKTGEVLPCCSRQGEEIKEKRSAKCGLARLGLKASVRHFAEDPVQMYSQLCAPSVSL